MHPPIEPVPRGNETRDRGVALFVAIWIGMAVAAVALGVAREARTSVSIAWNETRAATAGAAAEAGLVRLALALGAEARGARLPPARGERAPSGPPALGTGPTGLDGRPYALVLDGVLVVLRAQAMAGRLDLNTADPALFAPVFTALLGEARGLDAARAVIARRETYAQGRLSWRLDDRPFDTVGDLARSGAVSLADHARLAPYLTVEGGTAAPVPAWAPDALLDALPLLAPEARTAAEMGAAAPWREGLTIELSAEARLDDSTRARRGVVVVVEPGGRPTVRVAARVADRLPRTLAPAR